jgi:ATP-dependent Clp protease ATP-binding subunit ClpA
LCESSGLFERFTERARLVVVLAQGEARALRHHYIGTEHILLGLLREEDGLAARVLEACDVTLERVRAQVVRIVGSGEVITSDQLPFTPRAKKVLELSLRESLSLGHNHIGTEHILLGLLRENEGVAIRVLLDCGEEAEALRDEVIRMLSDPAARQPELRLRPSATVADDRSKWLDVLGPGLNQLAQEIADELGRAPDAGDLLLALACARQTPAGQALGELEVNIDALWSAIERARAQALAADEELRRQLRRLTEAKEQAIEEQRFENAAQLRDQERKLEQARARTAVDPEALQEIRRRLGLPDPPHALQTSVSWFLDRPRFGIDPVSRHRCGFAKRHTICRPILHRCEPSRRATGYRSSPLLRLRADPR